MAFIKLVIFGVIGLTVIYFSVSLFVRSVCKERLEKAFDKAHPDGGAPGARAAYIAEGLKNYDNSVGRKLIGLIYVVPTVAVGTIIYVINAN